MTPSRSRLSIATAMCAALVASLQSVPARADEAAPPSADAGAPAVSKWYLIPRKAIQLTQGVYTNSAERLQMLRSTSSLERLRDCEARTGVSLMTLWQFRSSSISLQAGRHGEPTLRWSSRAMHSGEATRGLLDGFVGDTPQAADITANIRAAR